MDDRAIAAARRTGPSSWRSTSRARRWRRCSSPATDAARSASRARPAARATAFCATATLGFSRNLDARARSSCSTCVARAEAPAGAPARNVVFMGMGEPMDNLDAVLAAVDRLTDEGAPRLAARARHRLHRRACCRACGASCARARPQLALSLNATTDEQRERLMPHNRDLADRRAAGRAARGPRARLGPALLRRIRPLGRRERHRRRRGAAGRRSSTACPPT